MADYIFPVRCKMVTLTMALFIVFKISIFAHTALLLIQYDRQALQSVCASIGTALTPRWRKRCYNELLRSQAFSLHLQASIPEH